MKTAPANLPAILRAGLLLVLLAALGGLGLAMWMEKGAAMFISLVEAGLAWCF
ncbi:hypothetical protein [Chelativorans sp. M5D2P16]|uniref:hypothetical protein n=1 Tax=Chelativorans sp. M5D2P16 TaxID=3095678 RepID=UPI002ACAE831|nr:hypothetical protein [Chelativorans sp. M5D2P16]MDZ5698181.1 hypothetical protein [Chelativorans sp. M5D2P16]